MGLWGGGGEALKREGELNKFHASERGAYLRGEEGLIEDLRYIRSVIVAVHQLLTLQIMGLSIECSPLGWQ